MREYLACEMCLQKRGCNRKLIYDEGSICDEQLKKADKIISEIRGGKMSCKCAKCGRPCQCGEKYCDSCFLEECCKTDAEKNLYLGGHFYPHITNNKKEPKLTKEVK